MKVKNTEIVPYYPTHALRIIDNWDGEKEQYILLAYKIDGVFYSFDTNNKVLYHVGDKILKEWELN